MAMPVRIFSDVHFGDRSSGVHSLTQLYPLGEGVAGLILNGDTLDTRPGPQPDHTRRLRGEVQRYFATAGVPVTALTGNHDSDLSDRHACDLADGRVFVTHGDILFKEIVPWGHDTALIRQRLRQELPPSARPEEWTLEARLALCRRVTGAIPQRHQSEPHALKYAWRLASDTIWPPWRFLRILDAWRTLPARAEELALRDRPDARFIIVGHTHRPGIWTMPSGLVVINTGSFCPPLGGIAVDLLPESLTVRRIKAVRGEYRPGKVIREFELK